MNTEKMTTQELREKISKLEVPPEGKPPYWDYWRNDLRNCILTDEPENYKKWPIIRHTMLMDHLPIDSSWKIVSDNMNRSGIEQALQPPIVGEPDWYEGYSRVMIEQAAHLIQWENKSGRTVSDLHTVFEFGAGYGTMALLLNRLGFYGNYVIYDLPEMCLFQEWFLRQHGVSVNYCSSLDKMPDRANVDMLIAIGSISETPMDFREKFFSLVSADNFIFRYSRIWGEYDNGLYFDNFVKERKGLFRYSWEAEGWVNSSMVCWR